MTDISGKFLGEKHFLRNKIRDKPLWFAYNAVQKVLAHYISEGTLSPCPTQ